MNRIISIIIMTVLFALGQVAHAQERPSLTPVQKVSVVWAAANALTSFAIGWFVLPAAIITGKQQSLCDTMQGTYDPKATDQCAGGDWVRLIPFLRDIKE